MNDQPKKYADIKLLAPTAKKLNELKHLYQLKSISAVVEHLLTEKGFEGKEITIKFIPADLRGTMNVDAYRQHQAK